MKEQILKEIELLRKVKEDWGKSVKELAIKFNSVNAYYKEAFQKEMDKTNELAQFAKFKVGERVMVKEAINKGSLLRPDFQDAEGIVSRVIVRVSNDLQTIEFDYKVNEIKNDGTMSKRPLRFKSDTYCETSLSKN